jgi:signal recognition particle GTPase
MRRFFRGAPRTPGNRWSLDDFLVMLDYTRAHETGLLRHAPTTFGILFERTDEPAPLVRTQAILRSMTPEERADITRFVFEPSRTTRVARGAGVREKDVADVLRKFVQQAESITDLKRWMRRGQP